MVTAVLDVVPDPHHDGEQFETDSLAVVNEVALATPFDPPIAVLPTSRRAEPELFPIDLSRPDRRGEAHRTVVVAGSEENARTKCLLIGALGRERLAVFDLRLATGAKLGPGFETEPRIAGAVGEHRGADAIADLVAIARRQDADDAPGIHGCRVERGVEQYGDVGLADKLVVEQEIP